MDADFLTRIVIFQVKIQAKNETSFICSRYRESTDGFFTANFFDSSTSAVIREVNLGKVSRNP